MWFVFVYVVMFVWVVVLCGPYFCRCFECACMVYVSKSWTNFWSRTLKGEGGVDGGR